MSGFLVYQIVNKMFERFKIYDGHLMSQKDIFATEIRHNLNQFL
jgi:hypothetical protein